MLKTGIFLDNLKLTDINFIKKKCLHKVNQRPVSV